ncbi:MAG: alpha-L-arabinofuranosidase C-terminal domain-containing protein, partial [Gemmatimonadota bacterium]
MSFSSSTSALAFAALFALGAQGAGAQQSARADVVIDAGRVTGEIDPLLYGQFAEFMFEGVKGGLHAELLKDRGFEEAHNAIGLPRDWNRYPDDRNDDYGLAFRWDDSVAYPIMSEFLQPKPVPHALRVVAGRGVVERHGIYQSRIPVRAGVEYRGYLWIKSADYTGPVRIALEQDVDGGRVYAEAEIAQIGADWARYEFVLRPDVSDPLARFAVLVPGRGTLWLDQLSLMPGDAVGGVRADVFERVRQLRPAFIRWPGGNVAQDYHWQWGVGPRDRRPAWINLSWRNEREPSDFGTDEFIAFAQRVGAQPTLTVNVEGAGATPEEAAAWVEYVNGPASSRYGALRAANGHPEPYGVQYWEIGNEIWGDWVRGHSDAQTYARNFLRYRAAMLAVDSSLKFIAVGDNDMSWNRTVLRIAGEHIDYLAIHHYYGFDEQQREHANLMARPLHYERFYREVDQLARELVPNRTIRLAINEWGLDLPAARQYSMEAALYGARLMHVFERSSPLVAMSAVSDLVNGWPGGIIQAGRHGVFVSPLYYVNALYAEHVGRQRVRSAVKGATFASSREGRDVPVIDVVASRSADARELYIKLINTDAERDIATRIRITGAKPQAAARWQLLAAEDPGARNSFAAQEIAPQSRELAAGNDFTVTLPKQSVSVITLQLTPALHAIPLPEHPRPDLQRAQWQNLNGSWRFQFDGQNIGSAQGWWQRGLPSPRSITVPFPWGSALSGVPDSAEIAWYERTISVPAAWYGRRVFLVVGAADWHTSAWLDGKLLGTHQGGYTPFEFELTPHLRAGDEHRLVLRVDDAVRAFKLEGKQGYGNARGIWQTVYLDARGAAPIDVLHFTPDIDRRLVKTTVALREPAKGDLTFTLRFDNTAIAQQTRTIPRGTNRIEFE